MIAPLFPSETINGFLCILLAVLTGVPFVAHCKTPLKLIRCAYMSDEEEASLSSCHVIIAPPF